MKKFLALCFLISPLFCLPSFANTSTLKIAILLKNNNAVPYTSERYIQFYKQGINTAAYYGRRLGFSIETRYWVMADIPHLSSQVQAIKQWKPDLIIGPNYSNAFLLLQNYFEDILVLSAYANDQSIASMPSNFHSLNPLNKDYAQAFTNYLSKKYPRSGVVIIVDTNCKSCYSLSQYFAAAYTHACPKNTLRVIPLVKDSVENTAESRLLKESYENTLVLLLTTTDDAITLIPKLSQYTGKPLRFMGGDSWGSSLDSKLGSIRTGTGYQTIHIVPRSLKLPSAELTLFTKNYKRLYNHQIPDNVTYAVFSTINSVFIALETCALNGRGSMKKRVLQCYVNQLHANPNSLNSRLFTVETNDSQGSLTIDTIPSNATYYCDDKNNA